MRGTPIHRAWRSLVFAAGARRERTLLAGVQTYCLFLGHARSGHSVIGALLDAHRQIAISDEFDALRYLDAGFSRGQLLYGSIEIARRQAANLRRKQGRGGKTYSYHVPDGWQVFGAALPAIGHVIRIRLATATLLAPQVGGLAPRDLDRAIQQLAAREAGEIGRAHV